MTRTDRQHIPVSEPPLGDPHKKLAETLAQHLHADLVAEQLPGWFKSAPADVRELLHKTMRQWHITQLEVAAVFAQVPSIEQFAKPLLRAELAAQGWNQVDPEVFGLKQVWLFSNTVIFIANQQLKIVDTLTRKLLSDKLIPESLEFDLVSSTRRYSLLQAALQNFEGKETTAGGFDPGTAIYSERSNQLIEYPELKPETFALISRNVNVGGQYQALLNGVFSPSSDGLPATDPASIAYQIDLSFRSNKRYEFMAELQMALMKGHVARASYDAVMHGLFAGDEQIKTGNMHSTLEVMGFEVPGVIVLWPYKNPSLKESPCMVYLPQCPTQVFYEFTSFYQFKRFLLLRLIQPEFASYFVTRVPLRYRADFLRRIDPTNVSNENMLLRRPQIIDEPAIISRARHIPQTDDPFAVAWRLHLAQIKDDARLLAVPTADEDVKSRLARQAAYLNAGLSVLTLALGFVPVLGEALMAFGVIQVGADIYQGIRAWQRNDRVKALSYLFDVAQNVALVAIPGAVKGLKPSPEPVVDGLMQVTLENGKKQLWKPDLSVYQHPPELLAGLEPDAQGIYTRDHKDFIRIDSKVYGVTVDRSTGLGSIEHPNDPSAYAPKLRGNTRGGWVHELENPMQWSRLQLFRRLGPEARALSDTTAERVLQITATTEDVLRKVHMDNAPMPPLLADGIKRVRLCEQVEASISDMEAGIDSRPNFAPIQLDLLTRLSGWPSNRVVRVVDAEGLIVAEYGGDTRTGGPRLQIAQAQINKGELLTTLLEQLSQAHIENLLGVSLIGMEAQTYRLLGKLAEVTPAEQAQLVSRLYSRSETSKPELIAISNHLPGLPVGVVEELSAHLTAKEMRTLIKGGRLPLRIAQEAREYRQTLRFNRAVEGLHYESLSNADSHMLAWSTLPRLEGWSELASLELYITAPKDEVMRIGASTDESTTKLYQWGDSYVFTDSSTGETVVSPTLMQAVHKSLSTSQRYALDLPLDDGYPMFQSKIASLAVEQRSRSFQALGMQPIKPWFRTPLRLADGRLGYTLGGRAGRLLREGSPRQLRHLVLDLYPTMSEEEAGRFLYRLNPSPELAAREMARLKAELGTLHTDLNRWLASASWTRSPDGTLVRVPMQVKRAISEVLISAWRRQTPQIVVEDHVGYELDLNAWPVDSLPVLSADFSHVNALHLTHAPGGVASGFLDKFPGLRMLSIGNCGLTELPPALLKMPQLVYLNLRGNQIVFSPSAMEILSTLTRLRSLDLTGNTISGTLSVHRMPDLQHLLLRHTGLQAWPEGVQTLTQLQTLDLRDNAIRQIPEYVLAPEWEVINRVTSLHDNPLSADALRRLDGYSRENNIDLGISPRRLHVDAGARAIYQWAPEPTREQIEQWGALGQEEGAADFFRVLTDLTSSAQFVRTREDLTRRVWAIVEAAHDNASVRARMLAIAQNPRTCSDGIAMIFADMELQHRIIKAEAAVQPERELLSLVRGLFRIEQLNTYVLDVINRRVTAIKARQLEYVRQLQVLADNHPGLAPRPLIDMTPVERQGVAYGLRTEEGFRLAERVSPGWLQQRIEKLDPLEVQMFYHINLASTLELPARPTSMNFERLAEVREEELATAKAYVLRQETAPALRTYIERQEFWGDFLQRKYPDDFSGLLNEHQERMAVVDANRNKLSDEAFMQDVQAVVDSRAQAIEQVVTTLTGDALKKYPFTLGEPVASRSTEV